MPKSKSHAENISHASAARIDGGILKPSQQIPKSSSTNNLTVTKNGAVSSAASSPTSEIKESMCFLIVVG